MEAEKPTSQEPEEAELQPSKPTENETSSTAETETDAAAEVTQNGEMEQEKVSNEVPDTVEDVDKQEKVSNEAPNNDEEISKQAENAEASETETKVSSEENKKSDSRPVRSTRATKRKANDADENENMSTTDTNESIVEQKENVDVKSQDGERKENETVKVDEPSLKSLSTADGMGKGKRARIPNKRYSDIILSPNRKTGSHQKSFAEALEPEVSLTNKEEHTDSDMSVDGSVSNPRRSRTSLPREDLQDPKYLKPFKYGWKRELVWRATVHGGKKLGDIYYYKPDGKKLRSFREVSENLDNKQLSLDNFTFTKEAIGLNDTEKEIVRGAKLVKSNSDDQSSSAPAKKKMKKGQSPKPEDAPAPIPETSKVEKVELRGKKRGASNLTDVPSSEKKKKENSKQSPPETTPKQNSKKITKMPAQKKGKETPAKRAKKSDDASPDPAPTQPSRSSPRKTSKRVPKPAPIPSSPEPPSFMTLQLNTCSLPCSIGCEGVQGIIPTLQCRTCLCLYHHQCVGLSRDYLAFPYVCKNCQGETGTSESSTITVPPPLTPINALKSSGGTAPVNSNALPKLQRIPRSDSCDPTSILHPTLNPDTPTSPVKATRPVQEEPSTEPLVGSVTSWLPHNVKIINAEEPGVAPRPQYVEYLGGRKFLVIPKHNYMSVSSSGGLSKPEETIQTPQPMEVPINSASLGPGGDDVKDEPPSPKLAARKSDETSEAATPQSTASLPTKPARRNLKLKNITNSATSSSNAAEAKTEMSAHFLGDCASIFNSLLHVFQYLKVQDLLRAGCVSRMWRAMADNPLLWRTVRMKNSQVHSFEGLANALKKHGTVHLDLRKMLLPSSGDDIWPDFSSAIARVDSLRKIEFCRCPATVVEQLATSNPHLEVINAVTIKCESLNLDPFKSLTAIRELRLKSTSGLNINSIDSLSHLKTLKILSLTSVIDLHKLNLAVIGELTNLESLDLGECLDFPENFGKDILLKLDKLEKLRLEKGQGNCHTFQILESIKDLKKLEQLELVNFDVKPGFDKALGACKNIKRLMIIPTYISQSATTNNMVLAGVLRLQGTLAHFVWGVTLELLRVTELFIDQCEDTNKRDKKVGNNGDCIPVLKPVPDLSNGNAIQSASNPPQVEILPLPNLQKLLLNSLPTTRVKILKIPFHATWRQTLVDSL